MSDVLNVAVRDTRGTAHARRQRRAGTIPAVLYGRGEKNVSLSLPSEEIEAAIRHGSHVVELKGAASTSALIRDVQWDTYGHDVLHVDLLRVSQDESVEVSVVVELRGEAPGAREGGIVELLVHELEIECKVAVIPDKLEININELRIGDEITVAQIALPPGAKLLTDPEAVAVQCTLPVVEEEEEEEAVPAGAPEPEVIGRKAGEEEAEES